MTEFLKGEKVFLRALEPSDIDTIYQWENSTESWKVSNIITPFSRHILNQYLDNAHLDVYQIKQLRLMIVKNKDGKSIGTIELFDFDPFHLRAGIGIMIHTKEERRNGFAEEALRIFINYSFTYIGLHQLFCNISSDNEASLKLFGKVGFKIIAKKEDWIKDLKEGWINEYLLQLINK